VSNPEQEMLKILIEEVNGLELTNPELLVKGILEAERDTANAEDRRPTHRRLRDLIDEVLKVEMGDS